MKRTSAFPLRRDSTSSDDEPDFFDVPEEPCLAIVKRQLRHFRTWVVFVIIAILILYSSTRERPKPPPLPHIQYDLVDWTRYAYSQYATSSAYLCNAVMVFETLYRMGSRADRVLFYPQNWDTDISDPKDRDSQLLVMARDMYGVLLVPIDLDLVKEGSGSGESWDKSISKLLAFGETEYKRVIHLDSDVTVLQPMDELFFLPSTPVAMPRAYWQLPSTKQLSSLLIVIEPSYQEFSALMDTSKAAMAGQVDTNATETHLYDMELLNTRYGDSAMVLPHRQYGLISGEFRAENHGAFLGSADEEWNPDKVMAEAKLVHFSDWPLPKPWVMWPQKLLAEMLPKCKNKPGTPEESGCRDRQVWRHLYDDFRRRRRDICKILSFPAPDWPPPEHPESE